MYPWDNSLDVAKHSELSQCIRDLDVVSFPPRGVSAAYGWTVRPLKEHARWVARVVRQQVP